MVSLEVSRWTMGLLTSGRMLGEWGCGVRDWRRTWRLSENRQACQRLRAYFTVFRQSMDDLHHSTQVGGLATVDCFDEHSVANRVAQPSSFNGQSIAKG